MCETSAATSLPYRLTESGNGSIPMLAEFPWQIFMTPFGIPIAAIVGVFGWMTIHSVSEAVSRVMCNRNDTELKTELLARGFSSEEIIRTVEAGRETSSGQSKGWLTGGRQVTA